MSDRSAEPTRVGMLLYPQFTTLDLIGPHQVLRGIPRVEVDLIAKNDSPVVSDSGVKITPDRHFGNSRDRYDVLFVPGGPTTYAVLEDRETLTFLARLGRGARYITSVCTGSLLLAAAGLLDGKRATTHWGFRECLAPLGAIPADGRFVIDGNRITGGGVTAGIDFALRLAAMLADEDTAKEVQLIMEYDPAPPFRSGHPSQADPDLVARVRRRLETSVSSTMRAASRIRPA